jgi:hypothetical protein
MFILVIEPPKVKKVESELFFAPLPIVIFFPPFVPPVLTQLPHLPTYLAHFAMAKPIFLLN